MSFPLDPIWWNWLLGGIVLMCLELFLPGAFLLWFGISAIITGVLTVILGNIDWTIQVVFFCFFSLMSVFIGRRFIRKAGPSPTSTLNRRMLQYLGRQACLREPIVGGKGRIKLDDSYWQVRGPELPAGIIVEIVAVEHSTFVVAKAATNLD